MIDYPPVTHHIPECFARKIEIDKAWPEFLQAPVVGMREFKLMRAELLLARDKCEQHIRVQRGGTGGTIG